MLLAASAGGATVAAGAVDAIVTITIFHICAQEDINTSQGRPSDQMRQLWSGAGQCARPSPAPMSLPQFYA